MILKVISYHQGENYHKCIDESGNEHRLDIFTDGKLPRELNESICGKSISVEYLHPYIQLAMNAKIIDGSPIETKEDK